MSEETVIAELYEADEETVLYSGFVKVDFCIVQELDHYEREHSYLEINGATLVDADVYINWADLSDYNTEILKAELTELWKDEM